MAPRLASAVGRMHHDARFDFVTLFALRSLSTGNGFALAVGCAAVTPGTLLAAPAISLRPERAGRIRFWVRLRFRRRAWELADIVGLDVGISLRHVHPLRTYSRHLAAPNFREGPSAACT